jgi:PAS domain S-box-containing protein
MKKEFNSLLPPLVGVGFIVVTLFLWQALGTQESANIQRMTTIEVAGVKNELLARMQSRILGLVRMARRWENGDKPTQEEWKAEAEHNVGNFPGYWAIGWADPWFFLRWAVPLENEDTVQELNFVFEEQRRKMIEAVRNRREVAATHVTDFGAAGKGFLVFVPIFHGDDCAGVIVGFFRLPELLNTIIHTDIVPGYGVMLFDKNEQIFSAPATGEGYDGSWGQAITIDLYGIPWQLRVWPQAESLTSLSSALPEVVLAAGTSMALLLVLAVTLAQKAQARAQMVAKVNLELEREIAERKRAEDEVRLLNDELEQRVEERTSQLAEANAGLEQEIAARARVEYDLRESEKRYRSLFENATDGIISFTLDGTITEVNKGFETMLGWSRNELLGQPYEKCCTPASAALTAERVRRSLDGEKLSPLFETEALRRDGSVVPIEIRTSSLHDREGKPTGTLAIIRDISSRKTLERQRGEFLAMLTHDIKSPLSVVLGYADLLIEERDTQTAEERENDLRQLRENVNTVFSLVDNYLNLSQIEDGRLSLQKEPLELNTLLTQVGQRYETEARQRRIKLKFNLQKELPPIEGDPIALSRVVGNLVDNALKFTPQAGNITVSSFRRNGEVIASIADTGPGIPSEEVPLLFEKYQRGSTGRNVEGTGLGLFIVKALVEAHGGHIEVKSTQDRGASFSVVLPIRH